MDIVVILTCFNRKYKTENCIHTLISGNPACQFFFVVVDDNSTDGTEKMLEKLQCEYDIHTLRGNGKLFYSGGMRVGMQYVLEQYRESYDYILLVNDDVSFFEHSIEKMILQSKKLHNAVIAGAMCDDDGRLTYGAVKYLKGIRYRKLQISEWDIPADTFCANGVLIPRYAFEKTGAMDVAYTHSMGDFDYGIMLRKNGFAIHVSEEFAGICNNNPKENTWTDISLGKWERIRKKESPKGLPAKQWFYFLKKNFGFVTAITRSCTPYIRILLGK